MHVLLCAAVDGVIDFRRANFLDPKWRRYVDWMVLGLVAKRKAQSIAARHRHHLAVSLLPKLSQEGRDANEDLAISTFEQLQRCYQPWLPTPEEREGKLQREATELTDAYTRRFGDAKDPQVQERIEQLAAALREQTVDPSTYVDNPLGLRRKEPTGVSRRSVVRL